MLSRSGEILLLRYSEKLKKGVWHFGMTVALIDGTVATQTIIVLPAIHIPNMNALSLLQHHWKGSVVVSPECLFPFNKLRPT